MALYRFIIFSVLLLGLATGCAESNTYDGESFETALGSSGDNQQDNQDVPDQVAPPPVVDNTPVATPPPPPPPPPPAPVIQEVTILENVNLEVSAMNTSRSFDFVLASGKVLGIKLLANDPDNLGEGSLFINNQNPIPLFDVTGMNVDMLALFDMLDNEITIEFNQAQIDSIVAGLNTLRFDYVATNGFFIKRIILIVEN